MNRVLVRCVLASAAIALVFSLGSAARAGTVVRFDMNFSVVGSSGTISYFDIELFDADAPITVTNFLRYVNDGLYNNTIIHRDAADFVVQGGGFTPATVGGTVTALNPITTYPPIQNEFSSSRSNLAGTVAMAKLGGDPNSATSQWFVNLGDNSSNLDFQNGGFTVFGRVIGEGMTLINAINSLSRYNLTAQFGGAFDEVPMFNNGTSFVTVTKAAVYTPPAPTPTGSLSGCVYVDFNHNGIMDGADYAIADAKVSVMLSGSSTVLATVSSGKDGSYHFSNLPAGTYTVRMQTPSSVPGQDNGSLQLMLDAGGNVVGTGPIGSVGPNVADNVALGADYAGRNFSFAQTAYPAALMSARMLLNDYPGIPHTIALPALGTNASGSALSLGNVLVGTSASTTLTVTNLGGPGSALSGSLSGASGEFGAAGTSAFGPLDAGENASRQYTYMPAVRGANAQNISVTSNAGNATVTLTGIGVAPVQSVDSSAADAGLVRIGTIGSAGFTVHNVGDGNLSGLGAASNLNGTVAAVAGAFSGSGGSLSLADSASQAFGFAYAPTAHGADSTTVAVQFSNGSANGANQAETVNVQLSGQGVGPVFSSDLAPGSTLDFGAVPQTGTTSLFLNIGNISADPNGGNAALTDLTLLGAQITGIDGDLFSVVGFTAGSVLHQGDSLSLEIAYNGTGTDGQKSALLTILTDQGAGLGVGGQAFEYAIAASAAAEASAVPEPGTFALLAAGGLFLGGSAWRRRRGR